MPDMDNFFAHPGVFHRNTRDWKEEGQRHWFTVDPKLSLDDVRALLALVPVGAYVQCFDKHFQSPSDPGAWVDLRRYPESWTATFSNHGWSSHPVPIDFDAAARLFWDCRNFDYHEFLGVRGESQHMAHSGLSSELPSDLDTNGDNKLAIYLRERVARIQ
jgi:hypothetical protein